MCSKLYKVFNYRFYSNYFENGLGFKFAYELTKVSQWTYNSGACGGNFTTPNALLTSPSYPARYPNNADCIYTISQPSGTYINVTILNMDVEYDSDCRYDHLVIRDGRSEESPIVGDFCGSNIPTFFLSTQNNLWIR